MSKTTLIFIVTFILATLLRLVVLDTFPVNLTMDEVNNGYTAYSLLKTGKDEWGISWPLSFHSVGDFKPPGLIYATIPFVAFLGLSEWSVRLPIALASIFTVLLAYFLSKKYLFNQYPEWFHLLVLALFAFSPWHLIFSRSGYESVLATMYLILNLYFFFTYLKTKSPLSLFIAITFAFLSMVTYHSFKFLTVLLNLSLILHNRHNILTILKEKALNQKFGYLLLLLFFIPIGLIYSAHFVFGQGMIRTRMVFLINDFEYKVLLIDKLKHFGLTFYDLSLLPFFWFKRFLDYFTPNFYLYSGLELTIPGHPGVGVTGFTVFILFLLGLYFLLFSKVSTKLPSFTKTFLLAWLVFGFFPASIANNIQQPQRSLGVFPAILFIAALGAYYLTRLKLKQFKLIIIALSLLFLFDFVRFLDYYLIHYPKDLAEYRHYGWKEAYEYLEPIKDNYSAIYVDPRYGSIGRTTYSVPYLYFLFHSQYDPQTFQNNPLRREFLADYDKFKFGDIDWQTIEKRPDYLYVGSPWSFTTYTGEPLHQINFPNGTPALWIIAVP